MKTINTEDIISYLLDKFPKEKSKEYFSESENKNSNTKNEEVKNSDNESQPNLFCWNKIFIFLLIIIAVIIIAKIACK